MLEVLVVATLVVTGVMVGVEFAVAVFIEPIFNRLPSDSSLAARGDGARLLGKVMPVWYIAATALGAVWAAVAWERPQAGAVVAGVVLLVVSVVMSIALLVPINSRVASWSAAGAPADWRQQVTRWNRFHYVRVAVIVGAFALFAIAGVA